MFYLFVVFVEFECNLILERFVVGWVVVWVRGWFGGCFEKLKV